MSKTIDIWVTAKFEVRFKHKVTLEQFKELDSDKLEVSEVVDESVAYEQLSSDGDCEMEWDYAVIPPKTKPKAKKKK
jgi:hypothetical protein